MTATTKSKRGGHRAGSGRKPHPGGPARPRTIRLNDSDWSAVRLIGPTRVRELVRAEAKKRTTGQ
jgi:hypothetical protein